MSCSGKQSLSDENPSWIVFPTINSLFFLHISRLFIFHLFFILKSSRSDLNVQKRQKTKARFSLLTKIQFPLSRKLSFFLFHHHIEKLFKQCGNVSYFGFLLTSAQPFIHLFIFQPFNVASWTTNVFERRFDINHFHDWLMMEFSLVPSLL